MIDCSSLDPDVMMLMLMLMMMMMMMCYQDVLSLWDLHFLVMIWFSPDVAIQDFLLTTGCGSTPMTAYVYCIYPFVVVVVVVNKAEHLLCA